MAVCGDGHVDAGEDCDVGGTCIGGAAAGTACNVGGTTCTGGTCTTFGGNGCAANCTFEHDVPYVLVPGQLDGLNLLPNTSGVAINTGIGINLPLPFGAACIGGANLGVSCTTDVDCPGATCVQAQETLTVGKEKDGKIPVVVKASSVHFPGIPVSTLACGCIHGVAAKTCGGTALESDGKTLSTDCSDPPFSKCTTATCQTAGEPCAGKAPCAFEHGAGNTASGEIGCNGLDGVNVSFEQDSGGSGMVESPPIITLTDHGGPGSAVVYQTLGITAVLAGSGAGPCVGSDPATFGPDGVFCTADDPAGGLLSAAGTLPVVTGTATAVVHNANACDGSGCDLGPVTATGAGFSCAALECGAASSAAGGGLAGAFTFVHLDTVGDVAVTAQLFASGTPPTSCVEPTPTPTPTVKCTGDCDGSGDVTVNEIITMVNIALGNSPVSACPAGDADNSGDITINEIIAAVNNALNSCPA
jgi:hypothetical protein